MDDEAPEVLPQPRRRRELPRRQRLRLDLGLGALLLVLVGLVANALLTHHGKPAPSTLPASPPASSTAPALPVGGRPLPAPTDFVTVTPVRDGGWLPRPGDHPQLCPAQTECVTDAAVTPPVRNAVRAAFPGARITLARTVRLYVKDFGDALTAVDVRARRGDAHIVVSLRGAARTDVGRDAWSRAGTIISGRHRITQYETTLAQYDVLVQVVVPANQHQAIAPLARLANDVRLVARY